MRRQHWRMAIFFSTSFLLVLSVMAQAAEAGGDSGVEKETMFTLLQKGGPVMIPLAIASVSVMPTRPRGGSVKSP